MATAKGTVLLMGGRGFLGQLIGMYLTEKGYRINCVALESLDDFISLGYPCRYWQWDGESPLPDDALSGDSGDSGETDDVSIIINLAGDPISSDGWNGAKRKNLVEARLRAVEVAIDAAKRCKAATMIQASAIDFYGDLKGNEATDDTGMGKGFWPEATARLERMAATVTANTRLVILRLGEVFSIYGGPFRQRLTPYSFHFGSPQVSGKHALNWIHGHDLARLVQNAIENISWQGTINATAPEPCSERELHKQILHYYPSLIRFPLPRWLQNIVKGIDRDKAHFNVTARPAKSLGINYRFPTIQECLKDLLDRTAPDCFYYTRQLWLPAPPDEVWDFFANPKNWERMNPTSFRLKLVGNSIEKAEEGKNASYKLHYFNTIPVDWKVRYTTMKRGTTFKAIVQSGMMDMLELSLSFTPVAGGTRIDDMMRYQYPDTFFFIPFSRTISNLCSDVIFDFRHRALQKFFPDHQGQIKKAG